MLTKPSVDQMLIKARSHLNRNEISDAKKLYQDVLIFFPKNKNAQEGLATLVNRQKNNDLENPPKEVVDQLVRIYNQGQLSIVTEQAHNLTKKYPKSILIWNLLGAATSQIGMFDQSIKAFENIIIINPNFVDAHYNMGVSLQSQGKYDEAIKCYENTVSIKPNYVKAYGNMGVILQNQGKLEEAIKVYRKAILLKPNYAEALNNMGVALHGQGKFVEAIKVYNKAISIKHDYYEAYCNIGNILKDQGNLEEAIENYKKAIFIKPDYAEAYFNLGYVIYNKGFLEEAIEAYTKAISLKPDYIEAYYNMGIALKDSKKLDKAKKAYEKAISIKPDYAEAYTNMGIILQEEGRLQEALNTYKKSLSLKPEYAKTYTNMGIVLQEQCKSEQAIKAYKKALLLNPRDPDANYNMGVALQKQDKLEEAIKSYDKAILSKPNYAEAFYNKSIVLKDQGKLEESRETCKKATFLKPDYAEAYNNLGNVLVEQGKFKEAMYAFDKALTLKPNYEDAYYNSSFAYNLNGDLVKGLELYEWRLKNKDRRIKTSKQNFILKKSKSLKGKKILIYEEQGLGDIIQFCRYLPLLKLKGAEVIFKVKRNMHKLISTLDNDLVLVDSFPKCSNIDFTVPLLSLPYVFNTSLKTIPSENSYLFADRKKITVWENTLTKETFKIGICWQGSKNKIDFGRSFPLSLFKGISKLSNVELISLHKGEGEDQIKDINFNLSTLGKRFDSGKDAFLDTAAVMKNCDLIITSDTVIAHLAGALGCTTWVVLKKIPDWRWFLDRNDSPWYPNMHLYRQKQNGNWGYVFKTIQKDLQLLLQQEEK